MFGEQAAGNSSKKFSNDYKNRKLFVGGFPIETKVSELRRHFERYGKILSCNINADKKRQHLGFGFVEFSAVGECRKALGQARQEIKGKMCDVKKYDWNEGKSSETKNQPGKSNANENSGSVDIRKVLTEMFGEPKSSKELPAKPQHSTHSKLEGSTQRAQIQNLEEILRQLQELVMNKGIEIEELYKEKTELCEKLEKLDDENKRLNSKVIEHEILLREAHSALLDGDKENNMSPIPECCVCNDCEVNTTFTNCGHSCICYDCSKLPNFDKRCPICRKHIEKVIKIFL